MAGATALGCRYVAKRLAGGGFPVVAGNAGIADRFVGERARQPGFRHVV